MTRDEQRLAWRTYAAAVSGDHEIQPRHCAKWADLMVVEERKRFDTPDHSGDANKMVEPRPWQCLGQDEREKLMLWMLHNEIGQDEMWDIAERWLRERNGGTR